MAHNGHRFTFDGGAATFWGTALLAWLVTVFTLGICYPFGVVLMRRWKAKHSFIDGRRLIFTGSALGLWGNWLKWWFFCVITLGIYGFWVIPRLTRWTWEHTDFDPADVAARPYAAGV
ncbi:hypothetical protein [Catenulispora subtropica]|uniref:DUF898 family protein n=1 Tax=Catenulispora subtropica TaxID=450798 RepID=A0ABN2T7B7_9ACTN